MSTTTVAYRENFNSLSLLALKVKPNVFDLSSGLGHASIRDQIVRAQLLARDLPDVHDGPPNILVVGAGVAGLTLATAAAERGCDVWVVDTAKHPFKTLVGVNNRFVGPFMYEWPNSAHDDQSYPPSDLQKWPEVKKSTPKWKASKPISASKLASELEEWITDYMALKSNPVIWCSGDKHQIERYVIGFIANSEARLKAALSGLNGPPAPDLILELPCAPWLDHQKRFAVNQFSPHFVVLAAGMGSEQTKLPSTLQEADTGKDFTGINGTQFWAADTLKDLKPNEDVAIFGGGDGAIQDALRALTVYNHPIEILDHLKKDPAVATLLRVAEDTLAPFEEQSKLTYSWSMGNKVFALIDHECKKMAAELARHACVSQQIKSCLNLQQGKVVHFVRETHFTKSYLLNRFMAHLFHACDPVTLDGRDYQIRFYEEAASSKTAGGGFQIATRKVGSGASSVNDQFFHHVAVRFGIEGKTVPSGQMVTLTPEKQGRRTSLGHVLLPLVLEDETKTYP